MKFFPHIESISFEDLFFITYLSTITNFISLRVRKCGFTRAEIRIFTPRQLPPRLTADVQTETLSRRVTRGYNEGERDNLIPG